MVSNAIQLGSKYYALLKTTRVNKTEDNPYEEFVYHIAHGICRAKGQTLEGNDGDEVIDFVEVAGQRVRATHVFGSAEECITLSQKLIAEQVAQQKEEVEPQSPEPPKQIPVN